MNTYNHDSLKLSIGKYQIKICIGKPFEITSENHWGLVEHFLKVSEKYENNLKCKSIFIIVYIYE